MTTIDTPAGWVRRLVAVIITMTATVATLVGASAPASAEACSSSSGVSVVVDFTGATGGVQSACVAAGANTPAHEVITAAGFALTWIQRQPGFICQVNGVPAGSPCVNTPPPDAYWGLFWSDGTDGAWHYADVGVTGLQVPEGGYIGLAWQTGPRRLPGQDSTIHPTATPTTQPTTTAPAPTSPTSGTAVPTTTPTTTPTTKPTKKPTRAPTRPPTSAPAPTTSGTVTTTPTTPGESVSSTDPGTPTESPTESPAGSPTGSLAGSPTGEPSETSSSGSPTNEASETPTDGTVLPAARTDEESSRVPTWLTLTILVMLLLAIGMSAYAARRRTRH